MKIFVTGATGFIGSHVLSQGLAAGHELVCPRRAGSRSRSKLSREPLWLEGDLETDCAAALRGCDALIHLAAHGVNPRLDSWQECFRWNVDASLRLWRRAIDAGVKRLIVAGSCFEYGRAGEDCEFLAVDAAPRPVTPYAASKASATMAALALAAERQVELAVLRPFHVFGEDEPEFRFWPQLREAALRGTNFPMTAGGQVRDFVPVEEVARVFVEFLGAPLAAGRPEIYNVGTGAPRSLREFAEHWWRKWQAPGRLLPGQIPYRDNEVMRYVPKIVPLPGQIRQPASS